MGKMAMKDAESQNVEYKRSWHDNGDTQGVTQDSGHWEVVSEKGAV